MAEYEQCIKCLISVWLVEKGCDAMNLIRLQRIALPRILELYKIHELCLLRTKMISVTWYMVQFVLHVINKLRFSFKMN